MSATCHRPVRMRLISRPGARRKRSGMVMRRGDRRVFGCSARESRSTTTGIARASRFSFRRRPEPRGAHSTADLPYGRCSLFPDSITLRRRPRLQKHGVMKRSVKIVVGLVVVAGIAYGVKFVRDNFVVGRLPDYPAMQKTVWLDQGWQPQAREWYHHANQGTVTFGIPLEWFKALEQPSASFSAVGRLSDPAYLDKFGFIPGSAHSTAQDLPVGIATGGPMPDPDTGAPWQNPQTHADMTRIGFTCAACHTGRMTYRGTTILIDGGSALTDLGRFRTAVGLSLL